MSSSPSLLPPCEVLREWPEAWESLAVLRAGESPVFPAPSRYLHPDFKLERRTGRGRCIVAEQGCKSGELVLVDAPLAVSPSQVALQEEVCRTAKENLDFRKVLFSFCGDDDDDEARVKASTSEDEVSAALVGRILRRNCRHVELPPRDGEPAKVISSCGLWPLAAALNHSLKPNVARSFQGHAACYRLLRDVSAGEELVDNYLSPLLSRAQRVEALRAAHDLKDEGPDDLDAADSVHAKIKEDLEESAYLLSEERVEDAFKCLAQVTNFCSDYPRDPAFVEAFSTFAKVAGCLSGGEGMQMEGLAMALEHATSRQPFSTVSCALSAQLLGLVLERKEGKGTAEADEEQDGLEALAKEHVAQVYGPQPELFEVINPSLAKALAAAKMKALPEDAPAQGEGKPGAEGEPGSAGEPPSKKPRLDQE